MAEFGHITVDLSEKAAEFAELQRLTAERLDKHEQDIKDLWRRIHSISQMIEDRDQH